MRKLGLNPEDRINGVDALMQYGPTPVEMHVPGRTEDDVPEVRCISFTNVDEGSATFSGAMPEGTRFSMSILRKEDVDASARNCLEVLQERMRTVEAQGYSFSAMLCISCVARYFVLVGNENSERSHLMANQIPGVPLAGYYAFCEIGPTLASDDGRLLNRSHSASIAMCAF